MGGVRQRPRGTYAKSCGEKCAKKYGENAGMRGRRRFAAPSRAPLGNPQDARKVRAKFMRRLWKFTKKKFSQIAQIAIGSGRGRGGSKRTRAHAREHFHTHAPNRTRAHPPAHTHRALSCARAHTHTHTHTHTHRGTSTLTVTKSPPRDCASRPVTASHGPVTARSRRGHGPVADRCVIRPTYGANSSILLPWPSRTSGLTPTCKTISISRESLASIFSRPVGPL